MFAKLIAAWPYFIFYLRNRPAIHDLIERAQKIVDDFRRDNPEPPEAWKPKPDDAVSAMADVAVGKVVFTPKPVTDWTMREWETYWAKGSGEL